MDSIDDESQPPRKRRKTNKDTCFLTYDSKLEDYDFRKKLRILNASVDPNQAVLKFYARSGDLRFLDTQTKDTDGRSYTTTESRERLIDAIMSELPSTENLQKRSQQFLQSMGFGYTKDGDKIECSDLQMCGCCGMDDLSVADKSYHKMSLTSPHLMLLEVSKHDRFSPFLNCGTVTVVFPNGEKQIHLNKALSVTTIEDKDYWLHEGAVSFNDWYVSICPTCHRKLTKEKEVPRFSLKNVQFGSLSAVGLEDLTNIERTMVSTMRGFHTIVKIQSNKLALSDRTTNELKGHWIVFNSDIVEVLTEELFTARAWEKQVMVELLCPKGQKDRFVYLTKMSGILSGDAKKLFSFLKMKQILDPEHYGSLPLPEFSQFETEVNTLPELLIQNALISENSAIAMAESRRGSDYANVRTSNSTRDIEERQPSSSFEPQSNPVHIATESVFVHTKTNEKTTQEEKEDTTNKHILESIARVLNNRNSSSKTATSKRSSSACNEFMEGDGIVAGLFPDIFLFGVAYNDNGSPPTFFQIQHLLQQGWMRVSNSTNLLAYLYDMKMRHSNVQEVARQFKGYPGVFLKLQRDINTPHFIYTVQQALLNPNGQEAKTVKRTIHPLLHQAGANVRFGPMNMNRVTAEIYSLCQFYGEPYCYITFNMDDINNPTCIRLATRIRKNDMFPAKADESFFNTLRSQTILVREDETPMPLNFMSVLRLSQNNPVAVARMFKTLLESVFHHAFDLHASGNGGKDYRLYSERKSGVGVNGTSLAAHAVNETTGKGALHTHLVLFGGLPPKLVSKHASIGEVAEAILKVFDTMYKTELPKEVHCCHIVEQFTRKAFSGASLKLGPTRKPLFHAPPLITSPLYKHHCIANAQRNNVHAHSHTCFKGSMGYRGCRLCYAQGLSDSTRILQLGDERDEYNIPVPLEDIQPPKHHVANDDYPFPAIEQRCLIMETKRRICTGLEQINHDTEQNLQRLSKRSPELTNIYDNMARTEDGIAKLSILDCLFESFGKHASLNLKEYLCSLSLPALQEIERHLRRTIKTANGKVVSYNEWITANLGCNTAICPLGDTCQSTSTCFYLVPYMKKGKEIADHCISAIYKVSKELVTLPSSVEEADKPENYNTKRFLQRTLNSISCLQEFSDCQMAYYLLGGSPRLTTETFRYVDGCSIKNFALYFKRPTILKRYVATCSSYDETSNNTFDEQEEKNEDIFDGIFAAQAQDDSQNNPYRGESALSNVNASMHETKELGRIKAYDIDSDGTKTYVLDQVLYRSRGERLKHMRPIEYLMIISVVSKSKVSSRESFPFDKSCPLFSTYTQVILQKPSLPILRGGTKKFPVPPKDLDDQHQLQIFQKKRDDFGAYYVALFGNYNKCYSLSHRDSNCYNYKGFLGLLKELKDGRAIGFLRSEYIQRMIFTMSVPKENKDRIQDYRGRERDMWTQEELAREASSSYDLKRIQRALIDNITDPSIPKLAEKIDHVKRIGFTTKIVDRLHTLTHSATISNGDVADQENAVPNGQNDERTRTNHDVPASSLFFSETEMNIDVKKLYKQMGKANPDASSSTQDGSSLDSKQYFGCEESYTKTGSNETMQQAISEVEKSPLNECQKQTIISILQDAIDARTNPNDEIDRLHLIIGPPGVGKSTISNKISEIMENTNMGVVLKTAYTGMAASLIGGVLFLSTFKVSTKEEGTKKYNNDRPLKEPDQIDEFRQAIQSCKLIILVIDEISQFTPVWLSVLNARLQQAMGNNKPFGGIVMIFMGDFMQIPPVAGYSIPRAMIKFAQLIGSQENSSGDNLKIYNSKHMFQGCLLLSKFKCTRLEQIVRSINDPEYSAFTASIAKGNTPDVNQMVDMIKPLSRHDFLMDPSWLLATFLVKTNHERISISYFLMKQYAKHKGLPIIRWRNQVAAASNNVSEEDMADAIDLDDNACFWVYFVYGIPGILLANINPKLRLANGTRVQYHSLTFKDCQTKSNVFKRFRNAQGGDIVTLSKEEEPIAINVQVLDPHGERLCKPFGLPKCSLAQSDVPSVVVAIVSGADSVSFESIVESNTHGAFKVVTYERFPLMPALSLTIDKAQGCTLDKVVYLAENRPPQTLDMTHAKFLVSISRVQHRQDIRAMYPLKKDGTVDFDEMQHISKLKPDKYTMAFLAGYPEGSKRAKWDSKSALAYLLPTKASIK